MFFVNTQLNVKIVLFKELGFAQVSSLNVKKVLFQTIQFSIITQFSPFWLRDKTLSGATTQSQSGPGSDGNKEVIHIPQSASITGASLSDCLISYI